MNTKYPDVPPTVVSDAIVCTQYGQCEDQLFRWNLTPAHCVIVSGSDEWTLDTVTMDVLRELDKSMHDGLVVLTGQRKGAERSIVRATAKHGLNCMVFPTMWKQRLEGSRRQFNPQALAARNSLMLAVDPAFVISLCSDLDKHPWVREFNAKAYAAGQRVHLIDRYNASIDYQRSDEAPLTQEMLTEDALTVYDTAEQPDDLVVADHNAEQE